MRVKLAAVQMTVGIDVEINLPPILEYIAMAGEDGADFVLFPEGALSGYHANIDQSAIEPALEQVASACAEHRVCALVGTTFRDGLTTYNQVRIYDDQGRYLGAHSKTLPTGGDLTWTTAGGGVQVFRYDGLVFGVLICNDMWCTPPCPLPDTHLAEQISEAGGKLIFHAINSGADQSYLKWHTAHQEMFARIYDVHILAANAVREEPVNSPTGLVLPSGEWLGQAEPLGEHYVSYDVIIPDE